MKSFACENYGMFECASTWTLSVSSRHCIKGGQTRVLEMLRRGGINYQAVWQNKVKIQGGGGALGIQGGASATLCPPLNETLTLFTTRIYNTSDKLFTLSI